MWSKTHPPWEPRFGSPSPPTILSRANQDHPNSWFGESTCLFPVGEDRPYLGVWAPPTQDHCTVLSFSFPLQAYTVWVVAFPCTWMLVLWHGWGRHPSTFLPILFQLAHTLQRVRAVGDMLVVPHCRLFLFSYAFSFVARKNPSNFRLFQQIIQEE